MFSTNTPNSTHLFVRSNIHMANLDTALKKHLHLQKFVDVTLSCEGRSFKCHRLILAAASPLFESLFIDNPSQHPIVIMPLGIKAWTVQALIDFMYKGHINVSQCGLRELVRSAESLQISGLDNARKDLAEYYQRVDAYKEVEANEHKKLRWKKFEQGHSTDTPHETEECYESEESEYFLQQQQQQQQKDDDSVVHNGDNEGNGGDDDDVNDNGIFENMTTSVDDAEEDHVFPHNDLSGVSYSFEIASTNYDGTKKRTSEQTKNTSRANACTKIDFIERQDTDQMFAEEHNDSGLPASPLTAVSKSKPAVKITASSASVGRIRVKSGIKLFDKTNKKLRTDKINAQDTQSHSSSIELSLSPQEIQIEPDKLQDSSNRSSASVHNLLGNFRYNSNTSEALLPYQIKAERIDLESESIICQPNVSYICSTESVENTVGGVDAMGQKLDAYETSTKYNNNVPRLLNTMLTQDTTEAYTGRYDDIDAFNTSDHIDVVGKSLKRNRKLKKLYYNKHATRKTTKTTTAPFSILPSMNCNSNSCGKEPSLQTVILRSPRSNQPRSYSNEALYNALMAVKHGESIYRLVESVNDFEVAGARHLIHSNPRSIEQAEMASREYQVPRKTLRNWMKRWDIKSQYPMPKQLKDAATKKKLIENVE